MSGESMRSYVVAVYASWNRISWADAVAALDFRSRALGAFDELRAALGESCGEFWFFHDRGREARLQIGVAGSGDPPAGPQVQAAKLVLKRHDLLDRSDFVLAGASTEEMLAAFIGVSAMLEGYPFARVALHSPQFAQDNTLGRHRLRKRLVIETLDGLAEQQHTVVDAAAAVAGVPVEITASLGRGSDYSPIPVREVWWTVLSVGAGGRSLLITHYWAGDLGEHAALSLQESDTTVTIAIALPDYLRDPAAGPDRVIPLIVGMRTLSVHLVDPVGGRRITGPECLLGSDLTQRFTYGRRDRSAAKLVPNVVGLAPEDALSVLRLQDFKPRLVRNGRQVIAHDPPADAVCVEPGSRVDVDAGP
jgi:hypothetical protein